MVFVRHVMTTHSTRESKPVTQLHSLAQRNAAIYSLCDEEGGGMRQFSPVAELIVDSLGSSPHHTTSCPKCPHQMNTIHDTE